MYVCGIYSLNIFIIEEFSNELIIQRTLCVRIHKCKRINENGFAIKQVSNCTQ